MAQSRRKKPADEPGGAPAWMVTYGDLMSLLLTFFVLLLSFSTISEEAFNEALLSLQGALGVLPSELTMVQINPQPKKVRPSYKSIEELARKLRRRLQVEGKLEEVQVEFDQEGGLKINLPSRILFQSGQLTLSSEAYALLDDLAELFGELPEALFEVRGHTDSQPLSRTNELRDNHDLSGVRADIVARYLGEKGQIDLNRFEIIHCGAGQPIMPNDTPEGREANRRVEIGVRGMFTDDRADDVRARIQDLVAE